MNTFEPIQPVPSNSPVRVNEPVPIYPPSNAVPAKLAPWYSNQIFRIVTFFIMMMIVLGVCTVCFFTARLSADQFLGVVSSLLFLATPSPLQGKPKKKVIYVHGNTA